MTQPFDPHQYGQQQAPTPGWAPPGSVPDPRQWQQMPPYGAYPPPPPPAPKKRKWPWVVGGLFVLLFVVPALGNSRSSSTPPSTTVASAPPSAVAAAPAVPLKAVDDDAPAAVTSGPKTSFGDGTWVVGEDIVPGNYKSAGAQSGLFEYCQITTHSDENAESSFLDWKNANADEPIRVKVSGKVKSVKVSGCEDFVKVG
ncbi:hypothetical protein RM445_26500 [Pseudonocardia sp. DSM 45834]|uniref:Uncharacterized protein n=2 Tax=Pseudonocardia charpentierae TaxID=3075545 RepID=A0ABU2NIL2_9PSEU|nr:hypothetical protein [Pseudonocardia sp. DSM 45834]